MRGMRGVNLMLLFFALITVGSLRPAGHALADDLSLDRLERRLKKVEPDLIQLRRDLHRHPEISGEEERTAGAVARRLRTLGLEVRTGVGGHGVVGILRGGQP